MPEPTMKCDKCKTEFPKRSICCPNCGEGGISKLYIYKRYNECSLSILRDKKIWFPAAKSLNDPFEFHFYSPEMHISGIPIDTVSFEDAKQEMRRMGVLSLSEINKNILMWSHYSESHTGFCIEFERNDVNELGNWEVCVPVFYNENLPTCKPIELQDIEVVTKILTTKSSLWDYEKEWRIIARKGNQTIPLPGVITGIIFGYKMPTDKRQEIVAILGNTVTYMEATKSLTKFAVEITPVALSDLKTG